ncbi:unnamed protein product [Ectocarpus sp. 6 AP-2014]
MLKTHTATKKKSKVQARSKSPPAKRFVCHKCAQPLVSCWRPLCWLPSDQPQAVCTACGCFAQTTSTSLCALTQQRRHHFLCACRPKQSEQRVISAHTKPDTTLSVLRIVPAFLRHDFG